MLKRSRCAKINIKLLVILVLVVTALGVSLAAARQIRRSILSKMSLKAGEAAFEKKDWRTAYKNLQEYLGRNPDDVEILKKYAKARLSLRPLEVGNLDGAIAAYRRVLQLAPDDAVAYEQLAKLYPMLGSFEDLAYIARMRRQRDPNDRKAPLWLADALLRLNKGPEARQTLESFIAELEALEVRPVEYIQACARMAGIVGAESAPGARTEALNWLNKAVLQDPNSVEALASRARFYRVVRDLPGIEESQRLALAREDLTSADRLDSEDPRILLALGVEWLAYGDLDRAAARLEAADRLEPQTLEEYFLDLDDWKTTRHLFALELAARRRTVAEAVSVADKALAELTDRRHRVQILPVAIPLYVAVGRVSEARQCLQEYHDALYTRATVVESRERLAYLEALVARAESNWYAVIDVLQPVVAGRVSNPELGKGLWRLLAEAFSRTDQSRRAVHALTTYLRNDPGNPEMTLQLAKEYLRLRDWNRAVETARLAEPLNPADFMIRLLRIEASVYAAVDQQQEPTEATFSKLLEELAQLRADHPDQVDIRIVQALVADHLKQPDKAEAELKLAIEECKEPLRAEMQLAAHYYREKDIDKAIGVCETACERHSAVAEPWLSLASLHTAKEDDRAARSCLKQGLQAAAGKWERRSLSIQLALLEFTQGDPNAGIERLSDLAEQDPQEIRARSLLLTILHAQTDQAKAQKLIEELRKAEGQSGLQWRMHQARLWLGSEEWRSKQQDIVNLLRACIDSDPQWSTPPLLLADMYEKLNDLQQVETVYRQALARNPSATDITDRLVTLLERQRRFSDAEEVLQQGEADPRVTSAYRVRRDLREGEFARATEELKLRAANNDRDADSRILLARLVYWQTRDAAQSLKYVAEAEAIAPYSLALTGVKAAILRADDRADEAQKVLDDYVQQRKDFDAYQLRAAYLAREGESEKAERDYKKLTTVGDARNRVLGYLLLSNFYAERNDPNQAVATLKESLDAYPEDLNLKRGLMRLLFRRARGEDRNKAVEILTALETRLPQDPELMRLRAVLLLEEPTIESVGKARAILETVVKLEPTAVDAHLLLIGLAMQASEHPAARDYAIRALGSNLNNRDLLAARARAELALENAPLAGQLARLILQEDPNHTEAISMLLDAGQRSSNSSLLEEARTRIEAAVRRAPTNEKLLLSRARILTALNQPKAAIPELETYSQTAQGNGNIAVLVTLADLHRLTGDVDRSKQWIEQAQRLDPSNQTVTHARLLWLVSQNRWAELKGIGSAYLSAPAQDPALLVRAGSILAVASEMELKKEGLQLFERAAVLSPTSVDARLGLASTLYQTGDAERAEKIYKDVLGQHPTNVRALNDLAWILQEHYKRYEDALKLADKGLKLAPKDRNLLDTRGTILMNLPDRLADAKNDFQELAGLWPDDTRGKGRALFQLGCVCAKMNDLAQAKEHLQKALEIARKIMETDPKADIFTADERAEIAKIIQEAEK